MGYYINPLFNVILGLAVLREKLNFWQAVSLLLAFAGVIFMAVQYGRVPWIALALTATFGLYGLMKKTARIGSIAALALETLLLSPAAFLYIVVKHTEGTGAFLAAPIETTALLVGSGIITALPLLWFARGARRIPLSRVGFIQYLGPTLTLFLGTIVFGEPFTGAHMVSFGLIWTALILFTLSQTRFLNNATPPPFKDAVIRE